jgi:imidazolonepropionase-like amidohydrolase
MMHWIAEHEIDTFGGSDLWPAEQLLLVPQDLVVRKRWFSDVEILRQNTSNAGRWLAKSGTKNPYREGPLGVIAVGAYADMILVNGDPLADVSVLADYDNTIKVVIKDGEIYQNNL